MRTIDLHSDQIVADCGLVWSEDLKKLFVISHKANDPVPSLNVAPEPTGEGHYDGCLPILCVL